MLNRKRRGSVFGPVILVLVLGAAVVGCGDKSDDASKTAGSAPSSAGEGGQATTTTIEGVRPSPGCDKPTDSTTTALSSPSQHTVSVGGEERTYLVSDVGTAPGKPAPVIVLLHGMGSSAQDINRVTDLPSRAAGAGMIVVTPQAVGTPTLWRPAPQGPDPAFLDQVLAQVGQDLCIDTARIHMAGFSVGAALAAVYACNNQDRIGSIVTVAVEAPAGCKEPMSILSFHGTADPVVAYGATDSPPLGGGGGTEPNMANWAATAGCQPTPTAAEVGSEVTRLEWPGCHDGAEVILYRITGGGHDWPGKDPATSVQPSTQQVSATNEAIAFFARHHR